MRSVAWFPALAKITVTWEHFGLHGSSFDLTPTEWEFGEWERRRGREEGERRKLSPVYKASRGRCLEYYLHNVTWRSFLSFERLAQLARVAVFNLFKWNLVHLSS